MAPAGVSAPRPSIGESQPASQDPAGTKRDLTTWWKQFKKNSKKEEEKVQPTPPTQSAIFGVPLSVSIEYANVAISLTENQTTYGHVPIVVAKCGIYLKEQATEVEGIFRLAGAERRIKDLMTIFNSPDRYGKGLDWARYTVHDAANLLRRYINSLPEPIIPLKSYQAFRDPLRHHQAQAVGAMELQNEVRGEFDVDATIQIYQRLISELPQLNRQLLLYLLDLLAVFASKHEINRMNASNLAAIFQPGILHHPDHHQSPAEYRLSQDILIFLIDNQDHFIISMPGSTTDDKTPQAVEDSEVPTSTNASAVAAQQSLERSTSTASAASQDVRRFGSLRRNASTNSRGSRLSNQSPSSATPPLGSPFVPGGGKSGNLARSNTLPTKNKSGSPALTGSERFQRYQAPESPLASPANLTVPSVEVESRSESANGATEVQSTSLAPQNGGTRNQAPSPSRSPLLRAFGSKARTPSQDRQLQPGDVLAIDTLPSSGQVSPAITPTRERGLSSFWKQSTPESGEKKDVRRHNKLQKKRPDGSISQEFRQHMTHQSISETSHTSSTNQPQSASSNRADSFADGVLLDSATNPDDSVVESVPGTHESDGVLTMNDHATIERDASSGTLKPGSAEREAVSELSVEPSPGGIGNQSASSAVTSPIMDNEGVSQEEDAQGSTTQKPKRDRWRSSLVLGRKPENAEVSAYGSSLGAEASTSSVGSYSRPRKSFTEESNQSISAGALSNSSEAEDRARSPRRGPLGWFKGKLQERQEKKEERETAKSPSGRAERAASAQSLNATREEPEPAQNLPDTQASVIQESAVAPSEETATPSHYTPPTGSSEIGTDGVPGTSMVSTPKPSDQEKMQQQPLIASGGTGE